MKDFLKNKQKWIVGLVILGLMFVAGGFGVASYLYGNRCYRGYEVKNKVNRSDKACKSCKVIPMKRFTAEHQGRQDCKHDQRNDFLDNFQLHERERAAIIDKTYAVRWHLTGIFQQSYAPREEYDQV